MGGPVKMKLLGLGGSLDSDFPMLAYVVVAKSKGNLISINTTGLSAWT